MTKEKKPKVQTKVAIEKWLARALFLTKAESQTSWVVDTIRFDAEKKELVATDGRVMLIVAIKRDGELLPFRLETGFYDVLGETLLKSDKDVKARFPNYEDIIPKGDKICPGNILSGIVDCMIKQQVKLDIWRYENTLKTLNKFSDCWDFTNEGPDRPVMMEADSDKFNVKYIIMPIKI